MPRALSAVLVLTALRAGAQTPSFGMASLTDGQTHCFNSYLESHSIDSLGNPDSKLLQRWPVKFCFGIPADRTSCRWSYEVLQPKGKTFTSWVLLPGAKLKDLGEGWKAPLWWTRHSKVYDEDSFKGGYQDCRLNERLDGGGFLSVSIVDWAAHKSLDVTVEFLPNGTQMGDRPLPQAVHDKTKGK